MNPAPHPHVALAAALPMEQRAALLLQLRRCGVRDVHVMRAIETVPRELFAPHRFKDLAGRNLALPIGCGQTMPPPAELGRRLEALGPAAHHRAFEVGAGSGYGSAVLARLVRELVCVERFETLAIEAAKRLNTLSILNAIVLYGDGLAPSRSLGVFDRILFHVAVEGTPSAVVDLLGPDGVMVFGRLEPVSGSRKARGSRLIKLVRRPNGDLVESDLGLCRQSVAVPGAALAL
jgi:protein-L-isoaspartate(D-aspartate) O-methyltransferase